MTTLDWKDTAQEYWFNLRVFRDITKQNEKLYDFLSEVLPAAINVLKIDLCKQKEINILSVGSGDGQTDLAIVKIVKEYIEKRKKHQGVEGAVKLLNRAIEPDEKALDVYENEVKSLQKDLDNVVFDLQPPRVFDVYSAEPKGDTKFDIVHFFHCFYYIDVEAALVHCYNSELRERGMIIICLATSNHLICSIARLYKMKGPYCFDQINESISKTIEKHAWKCKEYIEEHDFDVSEVFDEKSKEGNAFLDFLMLTVHFRASTSPEDVQEVLDIIKKMSIYRDGKYYAKLQQRIAIIYK